MEWRWTPECWSSARATPPHIRPLHITRHCEEGSLTDVDAYETYDVTPGTTVLIRPDGYIARIR